jgi:hypothetical protein
MSSEKMKKRIEKMGENLKEKVGNRKDQRRLKLKV